MSDLIRREDVIQTINGYFGYRFVGMEECDRFDETDRLMLAVNKALNKRIKALPSAEKVGHWIIKKDLEGATYGECSECGMDQYAGILNYCPNCGADMRGEKDE